MSKVGFKIEMVFRCFREKKRSKNGLELDEKISKTTILSVSDTLLTYF